MYVGAVKLAFTSLSQNFTGCLSFLFFFVSGLDFIGGEGSNYPRKFDTAPGTIHPGALTAPDTFTL